MKTTEEIIKFIEEQKENAVNKIDDDADEFNDGLHYGEEAMCNIILEFIKWECTQIH